MDVYLVRHGQTGGNVAHRHQQEDTELTPLGKQQAETVAKVIKTYEPTHLVSSSLVRAVQTADVIGEVCELIPDTNYHLIELQRPDYLYGHYHRSPRSFFFYVRWYLGKTSDEDGESYRELRERIVRAKEVIAQYPEGSKVVVVTHSVFMVLFLAHLCRDKALSPFTALRTFRTIIKMKNTHVVPLTYQPETPAGACAWSQKF